jgi:hypothetical protein
MRHPALCLAILLVLAAPASAQIGRVAGTVTDESGRPIKGATVTAENPEHTPSTLTSSTDGKGRFSILGLRRGTWTFTIKAPGFETAQAEMPVVTVRPNPPLDARLVKGLAPAPPSALAGMDPKEVQRRIDLADRMAAAGDLDGAVAACRELVSRVPALTSVYLQIGRLLERKGDTAAAEAAYERLLKLEPGNESARAALEKVKGKR